MKWKIIDKEKGVRSIRKIENYLEIKKERYLKLLSNGVTIFESGFESRYLEILELKDKFIYICGHPFIYIYNLTTKELIKKIKIETEKPNGTYEYYKGNIIFIEYFDEYEILANLVCKSIDDMSIKWKIDKDVDIRIGYIFFYENNILFSNDKKNILTNIDLRDGTILWQYDISQFGPYKEWDFIKKEWEEHRRKVNQVYFYRGKIIVTLSRAIIALEPQTGKLLWKIDFENYNPVDLVFEDVLAYVGRLVYYSVINVEKGEKVYERPYDPKYRFEVAGYQLSQIVYHGLALHNGHIWFTHEGNGRQFLLKANPDTGEILEGMLLDTNYSTGMPIFQDNRMYIQDQVGDMYVYEEVEEGSVTAAEQEEEEVYTQVLNVKGKKHVLIYSESWSRELEDKLESFLIQYWVNGKLNTGDEVKFVFQRTDGINQENLYEEVIKFLDCDRVRAILSSIPSNNVKAITGQEVHPEYQPYWLVNFFKEKDNFQKYFEVVE